MKIRDVGVVTSFECRRFVRSPAGILFLALFVMVTAWFSMKAHDFVKDSDEMAALAQGGGESMLLAFVSGWTDLTTETLSQLLADHPPLMLLFFLVVVMSTPLLAMIASMDQNASDIHTKHARYLLMRTDRTSLYIGKTCGVYLGFGLYTGIGILLTASILYFVGGTEGFSLLSVLGYGLRIWMATLLLAMPFITMMGLFGAMTSHQMLALLMGVGLGLVVWGVSAIGGWANEDLKVVRYAYPTAFNYHLMTDTAADFLKATGHILGFAGITFIAGLTVFRRRDI